MSDNDQTIFEECQRGRIKNIEDLLSSGVCPDIIQEVNLKDSAVSKDLSLLCVAAYEGHLDIVKLLIQKGAEVNHRCKLGESALFLAARKGHLKVTQCLLDAGAQCVYTAKAGDKVLCENWEVFTQALRNAYPNNIYSPENASYRAVAQFLLEYGSNNQRPNVLYEVLYCSLTVFANPVAVYSVGTYCSLSSEAPNFIFFEQNFLSALCNAFDMSRVSDFVSTVYCILVSSKMHQKDIAQNLVKLFNWADLLKRLAEELSHGCPSICLRKLSDLLMQLMKVFQNFVGHFNVRADIQDQFLNLSADDMGKIARLLKYALEYEDAAVESASDVMKAHKHCTWQFLFFLLKQQFRAKNDSYIARLLLLSGWKRNQDISSPSVNLSQGTSDFEKKVFLKCIEDDISLCHMLLDFGIAITGECLVKFIQHGHLDLVDRCKNNRELLFCKEMDEYLKIPITVKNSSNRNIRRCLKMMKAERNLVEDERRKFEEELLLDDYIPTKGNKKKKRQNKTKKHPMSSTTEESCPVEKLVGMQEEIEKGSLDLAAADMSASSGDFKVPKSNSKRKKKNNSDSTRFNKTSIMQNGTGDKHDSDDSGEASEKKSGSRKKRNKKKNTHKKKGCESQAEDTKMNQEIEAPLPIPNIPTNRYTPSGWREMVLLASRRRRQSSSSSECSTGPRKSVHFSHPLTFYENTKHQDKLPCKLPKDIKPKQSNLKRNLLCKMSDCLTEAYRTNSSLEQNDHNNVTVSDCSTTAFANSDPNNFDEDCYGNIPWKSLSERWAPRLEDLSEMDTEKLKQLHWTNADGEDETVYFCDNQKHLHLGSGPDFSNGYLGLTGKGKELSVKKISSKRAPLLAQKSVTDTLVKLPSCEGINPYYAVIKDRSHVYLLQSVGEYSLEQIIRRKVSFLPHSTPIEACFDLAQGLQSLHKHSVLHMDIKPSNVFLDVDGKLRLADYGIHRRNVSPSTKCTQSLESSSMCWIGRDAMVTDADDCFTKESDIASLGMVMFYVMTGGCHPFGDPDTVPGVCLSNIMRGTYNLRPITDSFTHHLIKNMIFKEPEKRLVIDEVVSHPCFWTNEQRVHYVTALADAALSGGHTDGGRNILQELEKIENGLLATNYSQTKLIDVPDVYMSSLKGILTLMYDCMHNADLYAQYTVPEDQASVSSPQQYFFLCFPGLLTHVYRLFSIRDLEGAILGCNGLLTTSPLSPPETCKGDQQCAILAETLNGDSGQCGHSSQVACATCNGKSDQRDLIHTTTSAREILTKNESELKEHHLPQIKDNDLAPPKLLNENSCKLNNYNDNETSQEARPSRLLSHHMGSNYTVLEKVALTKDRKNPMLCLSTTTKKNVDPLKGSNKSNIKSDAALFNDDINWEQDNNDTSGEDHKTVLDSDKCTFNPMFSYTNAEDSSNQPRLESPEDWIEIGSPLELDSSQKSEMCVPSSKKEVLCADSPVSSSSAGSVDDCFDFGSYHEMHESVTQVPKSPLIKAKVPRFEDNFLFVNNYTGEFVSKKCCTDIDELD
ncbi:uncharacterized protein LOC143452640 isoform X1 [Clavelina lepadiformis]|uniref:uncharacterized protein LOC143452640 isoform X1 n=1 Tax=Clavelina lepadiformis TaxID=159417 RepID=UPI004042E2D5